MNSIQISHELRHMHRKRKRKSVSNTAILSNFTPKMKSYGYLIFACWAIITFYSHIDFQCDVSVDMFSQNRARTKIDAKTETSQNGTGETTTIRFYQRQSMEVFLEQVVVSSFVIRLYFYRGFITLVNSQFNQRRRKMK